jgi:hypothetical protein
LVPSLGPEAMAFGFLGAMTLAAVTATGRGLGDAGVLKTQARKPLTVPPGSMTRRSTHSTNAPITCSGVESSAARVAFRALCRAIA